MFASEEELHKIASAGLTDLFEGMKHTIIRYKSEHDRIARELGYELSPLAGIERIKETLDGSTTGTVKDKLDFLSEKIKSGDASNPDLDPGFFDDFNNATNLSDQIIKFLSFIVEEYTIPRGNYISLSDILENMTLVTVPPS
jgi:hypothetical protein